MFGKAVNKNKNFMILNVSVVYDKDIEPRVLNQQYNIISRVDYDYNAEKQDVEFKEDSIISTLGRMFCKAIDTVWEFYKLQNPYVMVYITIIEYIPDKETFVQLYHKNIVIHLWDKCISYRHLNNTLERIINSKEVKEYGIIIKD